MNNINTILNNAFKKARNYESKRDVQLQLLLSNIKKACNFSDLNNYHFPADVHDIPSNAEEYINSLNIISDVDGYNILDYFDYRIPIEYVMKIIKKQGYITFNDFIRSRI